MQPLFLILLLFVGDTTFAEDRANNYIENFLSTAYASEIHSLQLEPAALPEFDIEFEEQVKIFGKVKGKAEFEEGTLEGLANAQRQSECRGQFNSTPRIVNCTISFDKLKVTYNGKLKYGKMPKLGITAKAKVSNTTVFLEIAQDSPMQPIVRNFTYTQMGKIKVKFTGLGPLNRFMNVLEEAYVQHVRAHIFSAMGQKLQYAINRALSKDSLYY